MGKVFNLLLFIWFLFIPVFWQLDLSRGTVNSFDTFSMAPYAIFHLIIFYSLAFFSLYFNRISFWCILLLILYFPFIQLANYPYLTIRDVYLHAAPTENILQSGRLSYQEYSASQSFWAVAPPESWPASFDLWAILSQVLALDLVTTNYILYLTLIVVFTFVLYSLARMLDKKGYRLAGYSAVLFLPLFFNHLLDNFHHYSRTSLGFTFLLLFVFTFMFFKGRRGYLLQLLAAIATLTTHPFQSLALVGFVTAHFVFEARARIRRTSFVLFLIVAFTGWFVFDAPSVLKLGFDWLHKYLSPRYITPLAETLATSAALPTWGVILREIFRYSLVALLGVALFSAIMVFRGARRRYESDPLPLMLISLLPMSIVMFLGLIVLPEWQISRFTSFAAFPAAFSSFVLLDHTISRNRPISHKLSHFACRKFLVTLLLLFIMALSALVMVLRFGGNFYAGEIQHPSELSSLSFFFHHDKTSTVTLVSWRTCVYASYFNYNLTHQTLRFWDSELKSLGNNQTKVLLSEEGLINQSQFVVRGIRDQLDFYRLESPQNTLNALENEAILPEFDEIYSNEYYRLFCRAYQTYNQP